MVRRQRLVVDGGCNRFVVRRQRLVVDGGHNKFVVIRQRSALIMDW